MRVRQMVAINPHGNMTIRITSEIPFSFSQYNTNTFVVVKTAEGDSLELDIEGEDLSALERGHYYFAQRVAENRWLLHSPYRIADVETAQRLGRGVQPIPFDSALNAKFGEACHRWEAVDRQFYLTSRGYLKFQKAVTALGGIVIVKQADRGHMETCKENALKAASLAEQSFQQMQTLKCSVAKKGGQEVLDRLEQLAASLEPLVIVVEKAYDGFTREHHILIEQFGGQAEKAWGNATDQQLGLTLARVRELRGEGAKLLPQARIALAQGIAQGRLHSKSGAVVVETLTDVFEPHLKAFPQLKHLHVQPDGAIQIEFAPGGSIRINDEGVTLVRTNKTQQGTGRMGRLEID